ncbi:hypothetical protein QJS10_CPA01g01649 [Acorus calamus]|uniref:RNase H type-1 domain-containing protein n=1 Tax=Acorus calamus TaxID=4465 RepID=A0AAV9FUM0_ACOCL|nr:hypothetical protein QJS10_CPA01g01649 [Acorus calamus]
MVDCLIRNGKWAKPARWPVELTNLWEEIIEMEIGGHALAARTRASSINILELKGIVAGIKLCSTLHAPRIWSETDSTTAKAWAEGKGLIPWNAFRDLRQLRFLVGQLIDWKITHVYREANSVADLLASTQSTIDTSIFSPSQLWEDIQALLQDDKAGKVYDRVSQ